MVWSGELHQQRHPWLKTDPFAITLHRRLHEEDKVTFTWLSNLTENSSILKPSNWSSVNMNVYILKHFCKPWEDTSLDISRGTNCWNGNFVLMYLVIIFASFYVIFLPPFKIEKLKVTHQSIKKKKDIYVRIEFITLIQDYFICVQPYKVNLSNRCVLNPLIHLILFIIFLWTLLKLFIEIRQRDIMHLHDLHR